MTVNFFVVLSSKWNFSPAKKNHGAFIVFDPSLGNLSAEKKKPMKVCL